MRFSTLLIPTTREVPADATMISHKLLVRGAFIKKLSAGVYYFLPLGWKVLKKVETVIREEMNRAGAQELLLPMVHPAEIWKSSGRWFQYGSELLRFKDRKKADYCLAPTHEEAVTNLVKSTVRSYKNLPINLYQIQLKFRDEPRPRAGLIRGREFVMKDAYSFDSSEEGAKVAYDKMYKAYNKIFKRLGFDYRVVEADTGNIGGTMSHEFQALAESGEDTIFVCPSCDYAANGEKAEIGSVSQEIKPETTAEKSTLELVNTPNVKTVDDVTEFFQTERAKIVKTLLYRADGKIVAALIRGDHELNEVKFCKVIGCSELEMASSEEILKFTGGPVGFSGPVNISSDLTIYADNAIALMHDFIVGANKKDYHYSHVNIGADFKVKRFYDLRMASEGDPCPKCNAPMKSLRAIELGHLFYLGSKYSKPMDAVFLNSDGKKKPFEMGCYGIGVSRILPAIVEQSNDDKGIIWPASVAPFEVLVLPLHAQDEEIWQFSFNLYRQLIELGIDAAIDDRKERVGVKFNDADLIGIPIQVIIGKRGFKNNEAELKLRHNMVKKSVKLENLVQEIKQLVKLA